MTLTRRELARLLLTAPLVNLACRRELRSIGGKMHGASLAVGHRLREATIEHASGPAPWLDVAIVGGGIAGLSAGWRLKQLGIRALRVFELESIPGGTSAYSTDGVVPHPWAAHYLPQPRRSHPALAKLLGEMGVLEAGDGEAEPRAKEEVLVREPEERVFCRQTWHQGLYPSALATPADLAELTRFQQEVDRWVAWRDGRGRRAFVVPSSQASDDAEVTALDRISAATWLERHGLRSPLLRWYVEYACRDDYGTCLTGTSAWAMMFYFASRVPAPGQPSAPFLSWPEGNGRLVRHLSGVLGHTLGTGEFVTEVVPGAEDVRLSVFDLRARQLRAYRADYAILAVPRFVAGRLLRPWREQPPDFLAHFSYGPWLVANLHLKARPQSHGFPFAWDNVLYDSRSLGYVVATHQTGADLGPTIWTWYHAFSENDPVASRQKLEALDHASIAHAVLTDLGRAHQGLEEALERIEVWRWGHAMVRPTPGFLWGTARRRALQPSGRVHFAHSDLSGLALCEEALDHGIRAAEAVATAMGRPVSSLRNA
jgi:protoporphyrinogen oxidase